MVSRNQGGIPTFALSCNKMCSQCFSTQDFFCSIQQNFSSHSNRNIKMFRNESFSSHSIFYKCEGGKNVWWSIARPYLNLNVRDPSLPPYVKSLNLLCLTSVSNTNLFTLYTLDLSLFLFLFLLTIPQRGNLVSSQHALQSLMGVAGTLRTLVLADNPLSEMEDYRLIVISRLPLLERLDKGQVSPVEKAGALERIKV